MRGYWIAEPQHCSGILQDSWWPVDCRCTCSARELRGSSPAHLSRHSWTDRDFVSVSGSVAGTVWCTPSCGVRCHESSGSAFGRHSEHPWDGARPDCPREWPAIMGTFVAWPRTRENAASGAEGREIISESPHLINFLQRQLTICNWLWIWESNCP